VCGGVYWRSRGTTGHGYFHFLKGSRYYRSVCNSIVACNRKIRSKDGECIKQSTFCHVAVDIPCKSPSYDNIIHEILITAYERKLYCTPTRRQRIVTDNM